MTNPPKTRKSPDRLALIGFMGAGKTVVGRGVAARLDFEFVDTDAEVEARAGRSISRMFEEDGEAAFRDLERAVVEAALERERVVLSLGGGVVVDDDLLTHVLQSTWVVHLSAPFDVLVTRVGEGGTRPLFQDVSEARRLFLEREAAYARADAIVPTADRRVPDVVAAVVAWWRERTGT